MLPAAGRARNPWKNGGGFTTEIAASPTASTLEDFDWRVSLAEITQAGPFSSFPGCDRTLQLWRGADLVLRFAGLAEVQLNPASPSCRFAGEHATTAEVRREEVTALNVMSRRGVFEHTVERFQLAGSLTFFPAPAAVALVRTGEVEVRRPGVARLASGDGVLLTREAAEVTGAPWADLFVIRFTEP